MAVLPIEAVFSHRYFANMQRPDWTALKTLLVVSRSASFVAAARVLGIDTTTVSRRIKGLERDVAAKLVLRRADGRIGLTVLGAKIVAEVAGMEQHATRVAAALAQPEQCATGTVRLTAVPILINRILVPALVPLLKAHPGLALELVPEARDLSLTQREADLALRLARPQIGGNRVKTRRLGNLTFALYAAVNGVREDLPLIGYEPGTAHLPQARWSAGMGRTSKIRVNDLETAHAAARAGLGLALLPVVVGEADPQLVRVEMPDRPAPPARPVWLLRHADQVGLPAVEMVIDWLDELAFG